MVSVIVPVYNAQAFLEEAIASILTQTVTDLELILINDGSTDNSLNICRNAELSDPRVTLISTPNLGVSAARNKGIDICKGDIITFVDADDTLNPDFIRLLMPPMLDGADIAAAACSHSPLVASRSPTVTQFTRLPGIKAAELSLYQTLTLNSPCGKLYRRQLFENPSIRFKTGIRFEDLEITTPLLCKARSIAVTETPLYFYRNNPGSFMNSDDDARADCLTVTDNTLRWVNENAPQLTQAALSRKVSASFHIFRWITRRRPDLKPLADTCFQTIRANRRKMLRDPKVRLKNKLGLVASIPGNSFLSFICKLS